MSGRRVVPVVAVLLPVLALTGIVSVQRIGRQLSISRACDAVAEGRIEEALLESEGLPGPDPDGRAAAVCRCRALGASGREAECAALLDPILAAPGNAGWIPPSDLAALVIRERRRRGAGKSAVRLARRAAAAHPEDATLAQLEIATRAAQEGEQAVLEDLERRLAALGDGEGLGLRLALGLSYARRQDHARVRRALGERPPPPGHPYEPLWFQTRAWALAGQGDLAGLRANYRTWREQGGDPRHIEADYALQLSIAQLRDPEHDWVTLLERALEHESSFEDPRVPAALYLRWIGHRMAAGDFAGALALYDRASARYEIPGITREQLVQRRLVDGLVDQAGSGDETVTGALAFRLAGDAAPAALHVSPGASAEPDAPFEVHALAPGRTLRLERPLAVTPERWVLRDAQGRVLASGSAWPSLDEPRAIELAPTGAGVRPPERFDPAPGPADGRRRVFVVVPDCGDWRLVQYLRARGELPVMDALLARGFRAVLTSDPPLTAAAMEKLVWPDRSHEVSMLGELNRLGLELAGLASVGRNPLGFLAAVLPEGRSVFERIGAGPNVAANLLFSHGAIDAGRHAELVGPEGARREGPPLRAWRELSPDERTEWPSLAGPRAEEHARTIAAEMDAALALARADEVDLLMLRVEPLDLLTHELFGELTGTRQDDGRSGLLDAYRYLDRRIGELWNALDADDVLVVMSDHGIRTALEHANDAVFVAVGEGAPAARAAGRPEIAGVPRLLASLFELETRWPETELVTAWASARAQAEAPVGAASAAR